MDQHLHQEAIHGHETNPSGGFECNICLDLVQDPVVTFCGHLYCWPCIYRWINCRDWDTDVLEPHKPQCPVCKTDVSQTTLIPLYGRGKITHSLKHVNMNNLIPQRPPSPRCAPNTTTTNHSSPRHHRLHHRPNNYMASPMVDPMIGMFGEMFYARIFGNSDTTWYTYPNSYHLGGSTSPRLRRHMMQSDKSLSRVLFFFFCCAMVCLLLF